MIPRDETEAANWKPQNVPKPPLPAITIPNPAEEERAIPERELPSRSEFVTEQFISNEGVAFFFPKSEANIFILDDVSSKTNMDASSKTNMATFEESKTDVMFKEVAFRVIKKDYTWTSMHSSKMRTVRLLTVSPEGGGSAFSGVGQISPVMWPLMHDGKPTPLPCGLKEWHIPVKNITLPQISFEGGNKFSYVMYR